METTNTCVVIIALNTKLTSFGIIVWNKNCNLHFEVNLNEKQDVVLYFVLKPHIREVVF